MCMRKYIQNGLKNREKIIDVATIISRSLEYINNLIKNSNNKRRSNELTVAAFSYSAMFVYFRQPTKRGEKAAASGGGSPSRVKPTA